MPTFQGVDYGHLGFCESDESGDGRFDVVRVEHLHGSGVPEVDALLQPIEELPAEVFHPEAVEELEVGEAGMDEQLLREFRQLLDLQVLVNLLQELADVVVVVVADAVALVLGLAGDEEPVQEVVHALRVDVEREAAEG